jgi:hypothetical protein
MIMEWLKPPCGSISTSLVANVTTLVGPISQLVTLVASEAVNVAVSPTLRDRVEGLIETASLATTAKQILNNNADTTIFTFCIATPP